MRGIIVSDTSCLILLNKLGKLDLLRALFGEITITKTIAEEFGEKLPEFIRIEDAKEKNYQRILETYLDKGEASAIGLAIEKVDCLMVLDDQKARKEAKQLELDFTGTIGILILSIEKGLIGNVDDLIMKINATDFRISEVYLNEMRRLSKKA